MNLTAVSGTILTTLIPLPLHNDFNPPSFIMYFKPPTTPMGFFWDA